MNNEILIKLHVYKENLFEKIFFLDKSGLNNQLNEENIELLIDSRKTKFKKYFISNEEKIYEIKLFFNNNIIDCLNMFYYCEYIIDIDLSLFNTKNVVDMAGMFFGCKNLTHINLSSFNTENVTRMSLMFYCCEKLTCIDLSSFNTKKVVDMCKMFFNCANLTNLNLILIMSVICRACF